MDYCLPSVYQTFVRLLPSISTTLLTSNIGYSYQSRARRPLQSRYYALDNQSSCRPSAGIHGGKGIRRRSAKVLTYDSYNPRILVNCSSAASPSLIGIPASLSILRIFVILKVRTSFVSYLGGSVLRTWLRSTAA